MYMNDGNKTKINLRNKSVFITGVAGFIGSNLAKRLLSTVEGVKVVGLDNMNVVRFGRSNHVHTEATGIYGPAYWRNEEKTDKVLPRCL